MVESFIHSYPPSKPPAQLNPIVLAYIGDAVFEVLVRTYLISHPKLQMHHVHQSATKFVSAQAQHQLLLRWAQHLTEEEQDIVRRGRNAKSGTAPKNADMIDYRQATALEALVGYLYFQGRHDRIHELMDVAFAQEGD